MTTHSTQQLLTARLKLGLLDGAEEMAQRLVDVQRARPGRDMKLGRSLLTLAMVIEAKGEPARAAPHFDECLELIRRDWGPEHPYVAHTLVFRTRCLLAAEAWEEALRSARESADLNTKVFGRDHEQHGLAAHDLGRALLRTGDAAGCLPWLREAVRVLRANRPWSKDEANALQQISEALAALGRADEAAEALREVLALYEKTGVTGNDPRTAAVRRRIDELGR
jgi:tetratricopeptide (TPR) repeat protein